MSHFVQLHLLTSYPPANLNRDDLGRPKTARMGGAERLRVSSQSLKRHWRTADAFQQALAGHLGTRTKRLAQEHAYDPLVAAGIPEKKALAWARTIAEQFGKPQKDGAYTEQLVHVTPEEQADVDALTATLIAEQRAPEAEELQLLRNGATAVDIALFGRMVAAEPGHNVEAACQVAHAISVHRVTIEDDYFTAVDDLNQDDEDRGAAHIGETGFAAGVFYSYICIDCEQLTKNLGGDRELAQQALTALTEAATTVAPSGKQNSFGSRAYASFVLAEKGDQQPRSLAVSFLKPVGGNDYLADATSVLRQQADNFDQAYGACADARYTLDVAQGEGSLSELKRFVSEF